MARSRDISKVLSSNSTLATDAEVAATYQTQAGTGLKKIVPSSVAVGSGTGSADSLGNVTFSGASTVSLNNVFSSGYQNYRIVLNITAKSASSPYFFRLRKTGTDYTTANYRGAYWSILGSTQTITGYDGTTEAQLTKSGANGYLNYTIDILTPFGYSLTSMNGSGLYSSTSDREVGAFGYQMAGDTFDGFTLIVSSGTITGTVRVYGYTQ